MRNQLLVLAGAIIGVFAGLALKAQTTTTVHSVTITSSTAGNMDVYRAVAECRAATSFEKVATNTVNPYVDTNVSEGWHICYYTISNPTNIPSTPEDVEIPSQAQAANLGVFVQ